MSYYDIVQDMQKRRCSKCQFFVYSETWERRVCGIGGEVERNCENEHEKIVPYWLKL